MAQRAGERVEAARAAAGVTQDDIALDLGVTQQTVSNWLMGKYRIPDEYRRRLAELVGIDLGTLQGWIAADEEQRTKRAQRELAETKRDMSEMKRVVLEAVKPVDRFVNQYEELGHTYRRLDETTDKILIVLEGLTTEIRDMVSLQGEILRLLRDQGGGRQSG